MMNINIILVGKIKEDYWLEAEGEYLKRLKPYAKINILELKEEPFKDINDREKIKKKEAEKIKEKIKNTDFVIALHERGKEMESEKLAEFLEKKSSQGGGITFIIGGPLGLDQSILDLADYHLSLSKLTFPHQMVRVILSEQIYRAVTIMNGKQYHY